MPALVRGGIDNGVVAALGVGRDHRRVRWSALAVVLADWVVNAVQTVVAGRTGERLLYTLRVKIFAQLQRLGLDYYERELAGRIMTRMTTDVDALSHVPADRADHAVVNSVLTFVGVLVALLLINVAARPDRCSRSCRCWWWPRWCSAQVVAGVHRGQGAGQRRSTPTSRRTWPACGSPRPTGASRRNADRFAGLSGAYRESRLRAQRYIALYFPFVQLLSTIGRRAGAVRRGQRGAQRAR